ncbi:MAG: redoxin family protein [Saprospiraceae bacterium]
MKKCSFLFALMVLLSGLTLQNCATETKIPENGARITGQIENGENIKIFVDKLTFTNQSEVIQKGELDGSGKFELIVPNGMDPGLYRVRVGGSSALLVLNGKENDIKLTGELGAMKGGQLNIEGAPDAAAFAEILRKVPAKEATLEDARKYVEKTPNAFGGAMIAQMFLGSQEKFLPTVQYAARKLNTTYPDTDYNKDFAQYAGSLEKRLQQQKAAKLVSVGAPAPDIKLPSPDGKEYALSDLKGKVVLLDFWASWCGPCRKSNPHVVQMYDKYNKKGFEVFNVSLDGINPRMLPRLKTEEQKEQQLASSKDRWVAAIKQDKLRWPYHVSDLQHWNSAPAGIYGVRSIPRTFLIDRDGNIAAANLRGHELEAKLKELL